MEAGVNCFGKIIIKAYDVDYLHRLFLQTTIQFFTLYFETLQNLGIGNVDY